MLEGGFLTGKIYEICGVSASGKTQLCLTISTNVAHDFKQQLHYIDTKRDFSGKRIQGMLEAKNYHDEVIIFWVSIKISNELINFSYLG